MTTVAENSAPRAPDPFNHVRTSGVKRSRPMAFSLPAAPLRPSIFAPNVRIRPPVISPADRLLLEDIFRRQNLHGAAYRPSALARRVPACLRALQARSPAEAQRRLEQDPDALEVALNALLIGVTTFFRDPDVFDHLRTTALPQLLQTSPAPRVMSVGCSDGSELVSLAICLKELGVSRCQLRGIDCRRRAIERAASGRYSVAALDAVPADLRDRYFVRIAQRVEVHPALRTDMQFQHTDALLYVPTLLCDLIACRNFAIYLEYPAAARLWRRLHAALRPGGLLLVGKAERPTAGFVRVSSCLYRKAAP